FWASITGKSLDLLPFDEISAKLHATVKSEAGLQEIPVAAIIGSVGRYYDFDKNFLPLLDNDSYRWARVKTAMTSPASKGIPAIRVYKIGEAYFVLDGNHRVSIAKRMGFEYIEAYVTEIKTKVSISPDISPEELILKEEYVEFLEQTKIDYILPGVDLILTFPGQYELLKKHISVHQYYMGIDQNREIPYEEAVKHWYEVIYSPVVEVIYELGILHEFPDKTKTDFYLWILDHQSRLEDELGWQIRTEAAADDLIRKEGKRAQSPIRRGEQHIEEVLEPDLSLEPVADFDTKKPLEGGCLFRDILVALNSLNSGWDALEQAIRFSFCVGGEIRGLHVIGEDDDVDSDEMQNLQMRFAERLHEVGKVGKLLIAGGDVSKLVVEHSLLNDLLVLKLSYPPANSMIDRWSSGFSAIMRKSIRPILVVRERVTDMNNLLLAYDGSLKSKEALFVSAYIAARWNYPLTIITIDDGSPDLEAVISKAKSYFARLNIPNEYIVEKGDVTELVSTAVESFNSNLLLIGGYGYSPLLEVVLGSAVDPILRRVSIPVLICQ
ncbi:MAG: universal stress protein, partial [Chloroflexota bacterium]